MKKFFAEKPRVLVGVIDDEPAPVRRLDERAVPLGPPGLPIHS
jgi:hypothetical protein